MKGMFRLARRKHIICNLKMLQKYSNERGCLSVWCPRPYLASLASCRSNREMRPLFLKRAKASTDRGRPPVASFSLKASNWDSSIPDRRRASCGQDSGRGRKGAEEGRSRGKEGAGGRKEQEEELEGDLKPSAKQAA